MPPLFREQSKRLLKYLAKDKHKKLMTKIIKF